ncbi:MAG: anti-sigma factor antagonist [bacterium]|nr:anti-sigma factor antagonist [bacterium]
MVVSIEEQNGVTVIELTIDELDADTVAEFNQRAEACLAASDRLILDMNRLKFIDSSGLGAVLSVKRKLDARQGKMALCRLSAPVREIMDLVRLSSVFQIADTREDAVKLVEG